MDVSEAARLYQSGLSARAVGAALNRSYRAVIYALVRAGIPRRPWDPRTGGAQFRPRIEVPCAVCGTITLVREYHWRTGNKSNADPRPHGHLCSSLCVRIAQRAGLTGFYRYQVERWFPPSSEQLAAAAASRRDSAAGGCQAGCQIPTTARERRALIVENTPNILGNARGGT